MKRRGLLPALILALAVIVSSAAWWLHQDADKPAPAENANGTQLTLYSAPRTLPTLHFRNAAGKSLTLAGFRGRVLLVNVWATWCPPCRKEMPSLDRLQATLGGKDFQVVAISQDESGLPVVNRFFKDTGISHLARYIDPEARSLETLNIVGIPASILVNRKGEAIGSAIGARDWNSPAMIRQIETAAHLRPVNHA